MADRFDVVVIGAGSAGFAAAQTASRKGAKVALVDKGPLGGLCILWGCMPSKALLRSAEVAHLAAVSRLWGIETGKVAIDFRAVMARKDRLIKRFADYRIHQIHELPNTELIMGHARFVAPDRLMVGNREIRGEHVIIATGSVPFVPPIPGLEQTGYILSDDALNLAAPPRSMLVIGGGVIAVELGQFYSRMGVDVTLVEAAPHLLPKEDVDVSEALEAALSREGLRIVTGRKVIRAERRDGQKILVVARDGDETELLGQEIFVAAGRVPNVQSLNLDAAKVAMDGRRIRVNEFMQTSNPRIYAAGDAWGGSFLVHLAIAEGELAARNAVEHAMEAMDYRVVPHAVFTDPNVARVGPTEHDCAIRGVDVLVATTPFAEHGKAELMGGTALEGFVKLIADSRTGEILGAQAVGPEVADLIHELVAVISLRGSIEAFMKIPHIHPTLAEIWTYPAEEIMEVLRARSLRARVTLMPGGYGPDESEECIEAPSASRPQ
ncbi:Mercuric reductase [compost metagenome]